MYGRIRRSEFETREDEFLKQVSRCAIVNRVPSEFASLAVACTPTHEEACKFEAIQVEDVHTNDGRNIAQENGWERLGCGVGRCAYKFKPQCVVKFARSGRRPTTRNPERVVGYGEFNGVTGEESNVYENAAYLLADEKLKMFLVPTIAHSPGKPKEGYRWIVQAAARTIKNDGLGTEDIRKIQRKIEAGIRDADAACSDLHGNNVGLLLNKFPVIIDYGFGVRCKRAPRPVAPSKKARKLSEFAKDESDLREARQTKHKGRHGLKRPRGGVPMGILTERRRILWQRAGALRREAKKVKDNYPEAAKQALEDARFLEQQAWHFQTKNVKKTLKNGPRMMALLSQTQREKVAGPRGIYAIPPRMSHETQEGEETVFVPPSQSQGTYQHETPPSEA